MLDQYPLRAYIPAKDLERAVRECEKRGIQFEDYDMPGMKTVNHIFEGGDARAAWFKDSEGNIMLVQAA